MALDVGGADSNVLPCWIRCDRLVLLGSSQRLQLGAVHGIWAWMGPPPPLDTSTSLRYPPRYELASELAVGI